MDVSQNTCGPRCLRGAPAVGMSVGLFVLSFAPPLSILSRCTTNVDYRQPRGSGECAVFHAPAVLFARQPRHFGVCCLE